MKKGVSPQQKQKMPSFTLWMLAAFSATLVITFWPRTSLTALDPTSLQNQRVIWEHALVNATQVSNHDVEGHNLLVYLKHQAIFTDGTKPLPSSLPDGCFHVVVLTQENDHPNAQWYEEVQRMKQGDVYASYHHDIKTILLRDRTVAGPIQGSILLHETLHAFHFNTKWKEHQLTPRESADEEIAAFTMQVRLFRKAYGKPYEALRASLFRLLNEDVQWRIKIARNADETVDASFPNPTLLTRVCTVPIF